MREPAARQPHARCFVRCERLQSHSGALASGRSGRAAVLSAHFKPSGQTARGQALRVGRLPRAGMGPACRGIRPASSRPRGAASRCRHPPQRGCTHSSPPPPAGLEPLPLERRIDPGVLTATPRQEHERRRTVSDRCEGRKRKASAARSVATSECLCRYHVEKEHISADLTLRAAAREAELDRDPRAAEAGHLGAPPRVPSRS